MIIEAAGAFFGATVFSGLFGVYLLESSRDSSTHGTSVYERVLTFLRVGSDPIFTTTTTETTTTITSGVRSGPPPVSRREKRDENIEENLNEISGSGTAYVESPNRSDEQCRQRICICIHGFLSFRATFFPFAASLRRSGLYTKVVNWSWASRNKLLEDHAASLSHGLKYMAELYPNCEFDYVTHSLGATVLRMALSNPNTPEQAKRGRAVLFAPCLNGSELARQLAKIVPSEVKRLTVDVVLGSKTGMEMMSYDKDYFDSKPQLPSTIDYLILRGNIGQLNPLIEGDNDGILSVNEVGLPKYIPHHLVELRVSHTLMLYHPVAVRYAKAFLATGEVPETAVSFGHL